MTFPGNLSFVFEPKLDIKKESPTNPDLTPFLRIKSLLPHVRILSLAEVGRDLFAAINELLGQTAPMCSKLLLTRQCDHFAQSSLHGTPKV